MTRGQVSIELLLLLAALFAFLLALAPVLSQVQELVYWSARAKQSEAVFQRMVSDANTVFALGNDNSLRSRFNMPLNATLSFDDEKHRFSMSFSGAKRSKSLSTDTVFRLVLNQTRLDAGRWVLVVAAAENKVFLNLSRVQESQP